MKTTPTQEEKRALIAREQGWTVSPHGWWCHPTLPDNGGAMTDPPGYDYDANAALALCDGFDVIIRRHNDGQWKVQLCEPSREHEATAPTLAAAICESYGKAKG